MPRLYLVDTNVVVSGVLRFHERPAPAVLLDGMLSGRLPFLLSADLLAEYLLVLLRPLIVARHGWDESRVDVLLAALSTTGYLRRDTVGGASPPGDPAPERPAGDEHVMRLMACEPSSVLVTGDQRLAAAVNGWRDALSPADAVVEAGDLLPGPGGSTRGQGV